MNHFFSFRTQTDYKYEQTNEQKKKKKKIIALFEMITNFRLISFCTDKNRFFSDRKKKPKKLLHEHEHAKKFSAFRQIQPHKQKQTREFEIDI